MKGNIRKRGENWQITIWTGKRLNGSPIRHYETVKGLKTDAQRRLRELLTDIDKNAYVPPTKMKLGGLLQEWYAGFVRTNCAPRTQQGYECVIRRHVSPVLGHYLIKDLQPRHIQAFYSDLVGHLSGQTVLHIHRVLSEALQWAMIQNYIARNPCQLVKPPKAGHRIMHTLSPDEVQTLMEGARSNYYYPVIYMAVSTGLRRNELLALRWRDVDMDLMTISVTRSMYKGQGQVRFQDTKTRYSRRRVSMTPKLALFLRDYKRERQNLYLELGNVLGLDDLVFANADCRPIDPSVLTHNFGRIVRRAGLGVRFHDLRHTCASLMLLAGVHPKIVSEMLGHSTVAITLDTYSHVTPGLQDAAARRLDEVLPEGVSASNRASTGVAPIL
jgi:integrase